MRSPSAIAWLAAKEWRELRASRAWWLMLAFIGPLVGVSFIEGVNAFAEVSQGAGAGCGLACAPLIGVWGPTFGAYEIAALFLLPFVAIRLVSGDRQSGALKLELQRPMSPLTRMAVKAAVLSAGWLIALLPAAIAIVLWRHYGGATYAPEIAVALLGHALNAGLTVALAVAIASVTNHPSTAAIATLGITVGTWIVDFAAAIHGGVWERLATYTPSSLVAMFQHGLVETSAVLIAISLIVAGLSIAAIWTRVYASAARRRTETTAAIAAASVAVLLSTFVGGSWDASESRQNSFSEPEEEALEQIQTPLSIEVHFAPQDPRRVAFDRGPLAKLRRTMPHLSVTYVARTGTGLYEQADPGYGEIRYAFDGRTASGRSVTDEGVLETVLGLAGVTPGAETEIEYRGHPLVARPAGAAVIFYGVWPIAILGLGLWTSRRQA